jgi:hypothetical protein
MLAESVLDYYMRQKRVEQATNQAVEVGLMYGEGYILMDWDTELGDTIATDDDGTPVKNGDLTFRVVTPIDVIRDYSLLDNQANEWYIVRTIVNKHDLAAKFPDKEEEIMKLEWSPTTNREIFQSRVDVDVQDNVEMYTFMHARTAAVPNGRMVQFVNSDILLTTTDLPFREMPIYPIMPGTQDQTNFGYTVGFDLLSLQTVHDNISSSIVSNQMTFGTQNVLVPEGSDVNEIAVTGGLNLIPFSPSIGKPEALNLTSTPAEIFNFRDRIKTDMETISGVNSTVRGIPPGPDLSGAAMALLSSQSIQFNSGLENSYNKMLEDLGSGIISALQDFGKGPRIVMIAGQAERSYTKEFVGDDLSDIQRVVVDVGSPLSKTISGKSEIARELLNAGLIKVPEEFIQVITTGQLKPMIEGDTMELVNIKAENEKLQDGIPVTAVATDMHVIHIKEHKNVLASPDARENEEILQVALAHMNEHINLLRTTDPALLLATGQEPLPPAQPPGMTQDQAGAVEGAAGPLSTVSPTEEAMPDQPNMPNMPQNPATGQEFVPGEG